MRYMFPVTGKKSFKKVTSDGEWLELQRFAKRLLRFVMFVAVAFVKLVCALANYIGTHRHALTTVFARPIFGGRQQPRARSQAALPFRDYQPVHFRADSHFKKRLPAHVHPADHSVFGGFSDKYGVLRSGLDSQQPLAHLCCRRRIPKLARQDCDLLRIGAPCSPDLHFPMHRLLCHSFFAAIPRRALRLCVIVSLLCLSNSRALCAAVVP